MVEIYEAGFVPIGKGEFFQHDKGFVRNTVRKPNNNEWSIIHLFSLLRYLLIIARHITCSGVARWMNEQLSTFVYPQPNNPFPINNRNWGGHEEKAWSLAHGVGSWDNVKLPSDSQIDREKLVKYLLLPRKENDKSKFLREGGYTLKNWKKLRDDLRRALKREETEKLKKMIMERSLN